MMKVGSVIPSKKYMIKHELHGLLIYILNSLYLSQSKKKQKKMDGHFLFKLININKPLKRIMLSTLKPFFFLTLQLLEVINMQLLPKISVHYTGNRSWEYSKLSGRICHLDLLANCHDLFTKIV